MTLDQAFHKDLEQWLTLVYERRETVRNSESHRAAERVIERHNRLSIALVGLLGASILLLPLLGNAAVLGALAALYLGTAVSSVAAVLRIRRVERVNRLQQDAPPQVQQALQQRPAIGMEERARLIRIMNLSKLDEPAARRELRRELAEARQVGTLAGWRALRQAEILTRDPAKPPVDAYLVDMEASNDRARG